MENFGSVFRLLGIMLSQGMLLSESWSIDSKVQLRKHCVVKTSGLVAMCHQQQQTY